MAKEVIKVRLQKAAWLPWQETSKLLAALHCAAAGGSSAVSYVKQLANGVLVNSNNSNTYHCEILRPGQVIYRSE